MAAKEKKEVEPSAPEETKETQEEENLREGEEDMAAALEEARIKLQESEDRILRLAADFENTKKRLEREREISLKYAEENILKELLPGIDNMERAMDLGKDAGAHPRCGAPVPEFPILPHRSDSQCLHAAKNDPFVPQATDRFLPAQSGSASPSPRRVLANRR